jgi:hypothetical protein
LAGIKLVIPAIFFQLSFVRTYCREDRATHGFFPITYTRRFFDIRATIANILEDDITDCFYNGITDPGIYRDFGWNRPKTVADLRDMMHDWSKQEEKMRERIPRRQDSNLRRPNDNRNDKGQRDFSGPPRKWKPDDVIAVIDRPSWGKKSTTQEEFEKLLQKKCSWHPGANHAAIDCYHLRRIFSKSGGGKKNKKPVDKETEYGDQEDHGCNPKFQDASKVVNVIFGGDEDFGSRRDQKLLLREILYIEPAVPRPLCWSEVPISFSRNDQWTSFSKPGKFPLVLDPVVAAVKLTKVLIDGGSRLNLIFISTLKKMGLDFKDMLVPSKPPSRALSQVTRHTRLVRWSSQSLSARRRTIVLNSSSSKWLTSNLLTMQY